MKDTSEPKKRVIICPPVKTSIRQALRQLKDSNFHWVYLGEDVARAIAIEQQLKDKGRRLETAAKLQEIAQHLRQPYIDYIGKLSLENHSILWWVGSISEKNPWVSKTFLYACYLRLGQSLLKTAGKGPLVLFVENKALRKCLIENVPASPETEIIRLEPLGHNIFSALRKTGGTALYKGYFLLNGIYRRLWARYYRLSRDYLKKPRAGQKLVLLHNWVDQRSFNAQSQYQDSYFGNLARHLRERGQNVVIVPYILRTVPFRQALKKMRQSGETFLVPESFWRVSDVLRVMKKTLVNTPARKAYPAFAGMEISGLLHDDLCREWAGIRTASSLLHYQVVKRWQQAGIPIDAFIYTYENHVWEKAYCMALREFYPSARIIGYQHATVPRMVLNYFFSGDELPIMPFPDKVITNGKYIERLFIESGYPPERVARGGAIRYEGLTKKKKAALKKDAAPPVVLVTPSIDRNESVELLWKVLGAFREKDQYRIIIKLHPVIPHHSIAHTLGPLPGHFAVSDRPVGELLEESRLLLYTSSATCIEALAAGVPTLHVESDFTIDRDDLADFPEGIRRSAKSQEDIARMTEEILKTEEKVLSEQRIMWEDIVSEIFGPVDEKVFDLFG